MATKKSALRVVSVQVREVLGARELTIEAGKINVFAGDNGSGKTSALMAIQAALQGGNLAKLARVDPEKGRAAEEPEVVLVLQGEGNEEHRVRRKGDKVDVLSRIGDTAAFEEVPKPQAWLSSLFDARGANPVAFLTAPDKDRAIMLLEALPLKYERAELLAAMQLGDAFELPAIPRGLNPLEEIAMIRDAVFRQRTGVNRDRKAAAEAADQVRRAAPAKPPDDPGGEAQARAEAAALELAQEIERQEARDDAAEAAATKEALHKAEVEQQRITAEFKAEAAKLRAAHEQKAAEIRAAAERRIAELAAEMETAIDARRTRDEDELAGLDSMLEASREAIRETRESARGITAGKRQQLQQRREELATLRSQREAAAKATALHEQAKKFDLQAEALEAEGTRLTAAIEALDAFRRRMAEDLPIKGLEIEGKEIRVNGVPFDQLNHQQRIAIAVEVASLRAKGSRLPVLFVDGAEALDSAHFKALVEELSKRELQAFLARVTDEPFTVRTEESAAAGARG